MHKYVDIRCINGTLTLVLSLVSDYLFVFLQVYILNTPRVRIIRTKE